MGTTEATIINYTTKDDEVTTTMVIQTASTTKENEVKATVPTTTVPTTEDDEATTTVPTTITSITDDDEITTLTPTTRPTTEVQECTASGKKCIFPFKWDKITYNSCTKANSDNGKAWCAHKVDSQGIVI